MLAQVHISFQATKEQWYPNSKVPKHLMVAVKNLLYTHKEPQESCYTQASTERTRRREKNLQWLLLLLVKRNVHGGARRKMRDTTMASRDGLAPGSSFGAAFEAERLHLV